MKQSLTSCCDVNFGIIYYDETHVKVQEETAKGLFYKEMEMYIAYIKYVNVKKYTYKKITYA